MTTPLLLDPNDTKLPWQIQDKAKQDAQGQTKVQDNISPDASSLSDSPYYDRLNTIRQNSATFTQGAINEQEQKRARAAAIQAAEFERQRQQALGGAQNAANNFNAGGYQGAMAGGDLWGSGGAQGTANVLRAAGFPESAIATMVAIAKAESGWNPNAVNNSNRNGSQDNGLFQINTVHKGNSWYPTNPNDPLQSAKAAYAIFQSQGLSAWTVYNSGAYKQFLAPAPSIQQFTANTGSSTGLMQAQTGQAKAFTGVPTTTARAQALELSKQVLNIPYVWGGNSLNSGVDCSGLVQQVYAKMGIQMPRQARAQATTGVRVSSWQQLQPGDLVAFKWAGGYAGADTVSHISIYIGNGQIIEAAGGSHGDIRSLGNSAQDRGAIYIHTRFPGE